MDTGNNASTAISKKLVEQLQLEEWSCKRMRLNAAGGSHFQCNSRVTIKLIIREDLYKVHALVGALAHGCDLLIGMDIIKKLNDKNFTVGE